MAQLTTHVSSKTQVLELLFPNGAWRALLAAIVWELYERGDPTVVVFRFKKWFFNIDITWGELREFLVRLVGPRPGSV